MSHKKTVESEAMHWGDAVAKDYHDAAERDMTKQWDNIIWPALSKFQPNLERCVDFACGRGRNTKKLLDAGAGNVLAIDVNEENIKFIQTRFKNESVDVFLNNGLDLDGLPNDSSTLVYSWDAMVHFDLLTIGGYLDEFHRILEEGGLAFIHHSNYSDSPESEFRQNPHWRNYMTKDLFRHMASRSGFEIVDQATLDWGQSVGIDCISVLRKPAR